VKVGEEASKKGSDEQTKERKKEEGRIKEKKE
jgi:hypothetical protein